MKHSIHYLAGVGAAALGLSASECPVSTADLDAYGDLLNGLNDGNETSVAPPHAATDDGPLLSLMKA